MAFDPAVYPPGTILQRMYLKGRLKRLRAGRFIEVGTGEGSLSRLLVDRGWTGVGYDLNEDSLEEARRTNAAGIQDGRYRVKLGNWLDAPPSDGGDGPVDLILSSMVLEHMKDEDCRLYFDRCRESLGPGGIGVFFVPSSPAHWSVEDEIAGHLRRYTFDTVRSLVDGCGWDVRHLAGLTYPVSNLLLPVSNFLVSRNESHKKGLSLDERTKLSGNRKVPYKTKFPAVLKGLLNEATMAPFHFLQKANARNPKSMVIYCECVPL